jgi:type IV pilus assembly protein PilC
MKFNYTAQLKTGEIQKGLIDARDKFDASRQVKEKGLTPISVYPVDIVSFLSKISSISFGDVSLRDKILFAKNLSGMLQAGLSLSRGLGVLEKQAKNAKYKTILKNVSESISKGSSLSEALQKFPKIFPSLFVSMIHSGEESGSLPKSLKEAGDIMQKTYDLNKKIKGAMMYPSIIFSAMLLIGVLMLIFVVPTLTKTFSDVGAELPGSTKFIISISDFIRDNVSLFLFGLVSLIGGFYLLSMSPKVRRVFDYVIIRLPVIGAIVQEVNSARTTRTLSSLLSSGVSMSKSLSITKDVLQNVYYKEVVSVGISDIEKGLPLSGVFKSRPDLYPVMVSEMIEVGEETGNLSTMMMDIASFYEDEVDTKTKDLSTIIEPVLMVVIGGAVGFFAVSMLQPMYSILETIG